MKARSQIKPNQAQAKPNQAEIQPRKPGQAAETPAEASQRGAGTPGSGSASRLAAEPLWSHLGRGALPEGLPREPTYFTSKVTRKEQVASRRGFKGAVSEFLRFNWDLIKICTRILRGS